MKSYKNISRVAKKRALQEEIRSQREFDFVSTGSAGNDKLRFFSEPKDLSFGLLLRASHYEPSLQKIREQNGTIYTDLFSQLSSDLRDFTESKEVIIYIKKALNDVPYCDYIKISNSDHAQYHQWLKESVREILNSDSVIAEFKGEKYSFQELGLKAPSELINPASIELREQAQYLGCLDDNQSQSFPTI